MESSSKNCCNELLNYHYYLGYLGNDSLDFFQASLCHFFPPGIQNNSDCNVHAMRMVLGKFYSEFCGCYFITIHGLLDSEEHHWKIDGGTEMVELRGR